MQRLVISTGGTGGHIFPALAVIEEIQSRPRESRILFLGGEQGPEKEMAQKYGIEFIGLPAKGVLGKGLRLIRTAGCLILSIFKCLAIYSRFRPDVVLGFGSYAGFVPVLLASLKKIPAAVHEQNSTPGVTNKILGRRVTKVFLSFPDKDSYFDASKVTVTGNPVRKGFEDIREKEKPYLYNFMGSVLILGGSQGATAINEAVLQSLPTFKSEEVQILHQSGKTDYERVLKAYCEHGIQGNVYAFIEDIVAAYQWADLVVCRAGASTVAELTTAGRPSVLIPYPYAVQGHQLSNAKRLEDAGAAIVLEQSYLEHINLGKVVKDLLAVPQKLQTMALKAKELGNPEAARKIVDELIEMTEHS